MPWAIHWEIREHIKDFREVTDDVKLNKGADARYIVLTYLLLRSNPRLRTYVSVETIMEDTGFTSSTSIAGAIKWLFDRGAIYNVPPQYRVGRESDLHHGKYIFQLTGVINLAAAWRRYLLFTEEDAEIMIEEWQRVGMELAVDMYFLLAPTKSPSKSLPLLSKALLSEPSLSEPLLNGG
jgi:hypothetical protein